MKPSKLTQELRAAGATEPEVAKLSRLASSLSRLKGTEPRLAPTQRPSRWPVKLGLWPVLGTALAGLAAGTAVVAIAQTTLPGNPLYPVKRISERLAVTVRPDYQTSIMMRRAREVKMLVATGQNGRLVQTALADYKTDMQGLKTTNYAALRYCHTNLVQAQALAPAPEKQQIATVLSELPPDSD